MSLAHFSNSQSHEDKQVSSIAFTSSAGQAGISLVPGDKTPPTTSQSEPQPHSTPSSEGTSAHSKSMTNTKIQHLREAYQDDLLKSEVVSMEEFLELLLTRVIVESDSNNHLVSTLEFVSKALKLAFDQPPSEESRRDGSEGAGSSPQASFAEVIRAQLEKFQKARSETGRYRPFVTISNAILDKFHNMEIPNLRDASDGDGRIIFQVNDPNELLGEHTYAHGHYVLPVTCRKPDVLILPIKTALAAHVHNESEGDGSSSKEEVAQRGPLSNSGEQQSSSEKSQSIRQGSTSEEHNPSTEVTPQQWRLYSDTQALVRPQKGHLHWRDTLSAVEFKKTSKPIPTIQPEFWTSTYKEVKGNTIKKDSFNQFVISPFDTSSLSAPSSTTLSSSVSLGSPQASSQGSATKRTLDSVDGNDQQPHVSKKARKSPNQDQELEKDRKLTGWEQLAMYGGEKLSSQVNVSHSVNLLIQDCKLWIYYFDRAGILRSRGLDIVENFAHFAVLIVTLQRFSLADWGYHDAFQRLHDDCDQFRVVLQGPQNEDIPVTFPASVLLPLSLKGRATVVTEATCEAEDPFDAGRTLSSEKLVVKIYHADISRDNEAMILKEVYAKSQGYDVFRESFGGHSIDLGDNPVIGHVPILIAGQTWDEPFHDTFRDALAKRRRMSRRLVIMLFPKLEPLGLAVGYDYWTILFDCFNCHYALWKANIHHRDISYNNIMFYRFNNHVYGVLNDFDLAIINSGTRTHSEERTGTIPFMAMDLLHVPPLDPPPPHSYTHDAESFFYVLSYMMRSQQQAHPFGPLVYSDWLIQRRARFAKISFILGPSDIPINSVHEPLKNLRSRLHDLIRSKTQASEWYQQEDVELYMGYYHAFSQDTVFYEQRSRRISTPSCRRRRKLNIILGGMWGRLLSKSTDEPRSRGGIIGMADVD